MSAPWANDCDGEWRYIAKEREARDHVRLRETCGDKWLSYRIHVFSLLAFINSFSTYHWHVWEYPPSISEATNRVTHAYTRIIGYYLVSTIERHHPPATLISERPRISPRRGRIVRRFSSVHNNSRLIQCNKSDDVPSRRCPPSSIRVRFGRNAG